MPRPAEQALWTAPEADFPRDLGPEAQAEFLIHFAHRAPSSHNTQPWIFSVQGNRVLLRADPDRWLKVADPDQRELFLSAGCALENLLIAAEHFEMGHACRYLPDPRDPLAVASIELLPSGDPSPFRPPELFEAIPLRHTNHNPFEPRQIAEESLDRLSELCVEEAVSVHFTRELESRELVADLVGRGDDIIFSDRDYRRELAHWIGEGVFGTPRLLSRVSELAVRHLNLGRVVAIKDRELVSTAPVLGILAIDARLRELEIKAGQIYERLSLAAAAEEIWFHPLSQVLQVTALRRELAGLLPERDTFPVILFRAGYADREWKRTPRRDLRKVIRFE